MQFVLSDCLQATIDGIRLTVRGAKVINAFKINRKLTMMQRKSQLWCLVLHLEFLREKFLDRMTKVFFLL